jgi:hypothetical protein
MNQTFSFSGVTGCTSRSAGTLFLDQRDFCDGAWGANGMSNGACVDVLSLPGTAESGLNAGSIGFGSDVGTGPSTHQ